MRRKVFMGRPYSVNIRKAPSASASNTSTANARPVERVRREQITLRWHGARLAHRQIGPGPIKPGVFVVCLIDDCRRHAVRHKVRRMASLVYGAPWFKALCQGRIDRPFD